MNLPAGWTWSTIGDTAQLLRNGLFASRPTEDVFGTPILRISAVRDGIVLVNDLKYVSGLSSEQVAKYSLSEGDLLFTRYNSSRNLVGSCARVPHLTSTVIHPDKLIRVVLDESVVDSRFVAHQMRSSHVRRFLEPRIRTTAGQSGVSGKDIKAIPIAFPPLCDQYRIVETLEGHLSHLAAAQRYVASAHDRVETLFELELNAKLASCGAKATPLGELLAEPLINGRSVPTAQYGFPVLRLTCLRGAKVDLSARKIGAWQASDAAPFIVRKGDFFVARGNGTLRLVGRGGLVSDEPDAVAFPDTLIRVRPCTEIIRPDFLRLVWSTPAIRRQIEAMARTTAGIYKVNQKDLRRTLVPVPSLEEQGRMVARFADHRHSVERFKTALAVAGSHVDSLRHSLLSAAFTGRLIGNSSNPDLVEDLARV